MEEDITNLDPDFDTIFQPAATHFPLFALPPELWLHIARLAVPSHKTFRLSDAPSTHHQARMVQQPAITRSCAVFRRELLPLFYGRNRFEACHRARTACFRRWFEALGAANLRAMRVFVFEAEFTREFWTRSFGDVGVSVLVECDAEGEDGEGKADGAVYWGGRRRGVPIWWLTRFAVKFL